MDYRALQELQALRNSGLARAQPRIAQEYAAQQMRQQAAQSVMAQPPAAPWQPDNRRVGGHALEAPMFSPDDLIGSGVGKALLTLGKGAAAVAPVLGGIIKHKGGKWTEDLPQYGADIAMEVGDERVAKFADTLSNYVMRRMGTQDDEVRKLAAQNITHRTENPFGVYEPGSTALTTRRTAEGFPEQGVATSPLARAWEADADMSIMREKLPSVKQMRGLSDEEFLKLDQNKAEPSYTIGMDSPYELGFTELLGAMAENLDNKNLPKHLQLNPAKLDNMSMEKAVRWKHALEQHKAQDAEAGFKQDLSLLPSARDYPDGYRWVELTRPGSMDPTAAGEYLKGLTAREGAEMQNCIRNGYCDFIDEGKSRIFSLRDPQGKPHADIEIQPGENGTWDMPQIKGKNNTGLTAKYHPYAQDFIRNPPNGLKFNYIDEANHAGLAPGKEFGREGWLTREELLAIKAEDEAAFAKFDSEVPIAGTRIDLINQYLRETMPLAPYGGFD